MNTPRLALAHRGSRHPQSAQLLFSSFLQIVSNLFLMLSLEAICAPTATAATLNLEPPPSPKQLRILIYSITVATPRRIYMADAARSDLKYRTEKRGFVRLTQRNKVFTPLYLYIHLSLCTTLLRTWISCLKFTYTQTLLETLARRSINDADITVSENCIQNHYGRTTQDPTR